MAGEARPTGRGRPRLQGAKQETASLSLSLSLSLTESRVRSRRPDRVEGFGPDGGCFGNGGDRAWRVLRHRKVRIYPERLETAFQFSTAFCVHFRKRSAAPRSASRGQALPRFNSVQSPRKGAFEHARRSRFTRKHTGFIWLSLSLSLFLAGYTLLRVTTRDKPRAHHMERYCTRRHWGAREKTNESYFLNEKKCGINSRFVASRCHSCATTVAGLASRSATSWRASTLRSNGSARRLSRLDVGPNNSFLLKVFPALGERRIYRWLAFVFQNTPSTS